MLTTPRNAWHTTNSREKEIAGRFVQATHCSYLVLWISRNQGKKRTIECRYLFLTLSDWKWTESEPNEQRHARVFGGWDQNDFLKVMLVVKELVSRKLDPCEGDFKTVRMMETEFSFCLNRTRVGIHVRQWCGMKLKRGRGADGVIWPCADLHWVHMVTQRTRCSAVWDTQKPILNASLNTGAPLCLRYDAHSVFPSWCACLGASTKKPTLGRYYSC